MDLEKAKAEEVEARMAMVRGHRNRFLTDEERDALVAAHQYAKTKVRVARALSEGPRLSLKQKQEIAAML